MFKTWVFRILIPAVAVMVLFVITAGVVFAWNNNDVRGGDGDLMARVARILGIDQQKLSDAFKQAQTELRDEQLARLVKEGKLTQEQVDKLKAWEVARPADPKANRQAFEEWMKAMPDIPLFGPKGQMPPRMNMDEMLKQLVTDGKITRAEADQLKAWEAARPADAKPGSQSFQDWLKSKPNVQLPHPPGPPFPPRKGEPPAR